MFTGGGGARTPQPPARYSTSSYSNALLNHYTTKPSSKKQLIRHATVFIIHSAVSDHILFRQDVRGCDPIEPRILEKISKKAEGNALCKTKSQKDGTFGFSSVPSGEYTLVGFKEFMQNIGYQAAIEWSLN